MTLGSYDGVNGYSTVLNTGTVNSDGNALFNSGANSNIVNTGEMISQTTAVNINSVADNNTLDNSGMISGQYDGIFWAGVNGTLTNSGTISGLSDGVEFTDSGNILINHGIISGRDQEGVDSDEDLRLVNHGSIVGGTYGIFGNSFDGTDAGAGDHIISNTGNIQGESGGIYLVGSNSVISNAVGGVIESTGDRAIYVFGDEGVINNGGAIMSMDTAIWAAGDRFEINNSGDITTSQIGLGEGIYATGQASIGNSGNIVSSLVGIYIDSDFEGFVNNTGLVTSRYDDGIELNATSGAVLNSGSIVAEEEGIDVDFEVGTIVNSGSIATENGSGIYHVNDAIVEVEIINSGTIAAAATGIRAEEGTRILNSGNINAEYGVFISSSNLTTPTRFVNDGVVEAVDYGYRTEQGGAVITNNGTVSALVGFDLFGSTDTTLLVNTGTIVGDGTAAINGSNMTEEIRNTGTIVGDLYMYGGGDTIEGLGGTILGDIIGGDGNDRFFLGAADNNVQASGGADMVFGRGGDDTLIGGDGNDSLSGGEGNDSLNGGADNDWLLGGAGDDTVIGGDGNDSINGSDGNDVLQGNRNEDVILGGAGDDQIDGGYESDTVVGGDGNDTVDGSRGIDLVTGGEGNDVLYGGDAGDTLSGGNGDDNMYGDGGSDSMVGGNGNDYMSGGDANDSIYGNAGNDNLTGGGGLDYLNGGWDDDVLTGGALADTFAFILDNGNDVITDFENGTDLIDLTVYNTSYGAMQTAISDFNGGAIIDFAQMGGSGSVWVQGTPAAFLNNNDFIF